MLGKPQEAAQESDSEHDTSELESESESMSMSELGEDFLSNQAQNNRLSCKNLLDYASVASKKPSQMKLQMIDVATVHAPIEDSDMNKGGSFQQPNSAALVGSQVPSIHNAVGALKDAVRFKNAR